MHKGRLGLLAFMLIMALAVAACAPAAPAPAPESAPAAPAGDQTLVVALAGAPTSLDPADHRSRQSETVIRNMFDGLVTRDTTNGVHLELAESAQLIDPQTWEFKLC